MSDSSCGGRPPNIALPTAAERARTVASRRGAVLCAAGISTTPPLAQATTLDGQVLLVVPDDGEAAAAAPGAGSHDLPALLMVSDRAPVPLRDPVRAQVWFSGWLTPVASSEQRAAALAFAEVDPAGVLLDVGRTATLLRLDLAEVVLGESGTSTEVSPEAYRAARPDLLAEVEEVTLQHLDSAHPEALALLAAHLPAAEVGRHGVVRPLGIDRCGVRLRVERSGGHRDLRVPFARPLSCPGELARAMGLLLCAARSRLARRD